jgi:uncharacterized protein YndB with AHSA1/START domain
MHVDKDDLIISHLFDAPREIVFMAWTDPEQLPLWYSPKGCEIEFKRIELTTGGQFHYCLRHPNNVTTWFKGVYMLIDAPSRIVYYSALSNEQGDILTYGDESKSRDYPQAVISTATFSAVDEQTMLVLHQTILESEARTNGAFDEWINRFDQLADILPKAQNP